MGSKKQSTQSAQTTHATTTPDVPSWLQDQTQGFNANITKLGQQDPYSLVPQANGLQTGAQTAATGLVNNSSASPALTQASGIASRVAGTAAPQVGAASLLDGLSNYYSPYKDQVLNPVLADFDHQAAQTRAAQAAGAASTGAFAGSRFGVREGATEDNLARARASTEGGLLGNMFTQATGLSNEDAARRQAADTTNAGLTQGQEGLSLNAAGQIAGNGLNVDANARANTGLLSGLGDTQYGIDSARAQAPITQQRSLEGLLAGLNPSSFIGQTTDGTQTGNSTTTSSPSFLDTLGKGIQTAASAAALFSDERLKTEIEPVGKDHRGREVYDYEYLWEPGQKRRGYMAQDLLKTDPQAVKRGPKGFLMVDYGAVA